MHKTLSKPTDIYLIRHAESEANADGNIIGWVDAKLTAKGRGQARALRNYLRMHPIKGPLKVFSSDMLRAELTARNVAQGISVRCKDIVFDPRLREIARGNWEGRHRDDIYTDAAIEEMRALDMDHRAPNGESIHDVAGRMRRWLLDLDGVIERDGITTFVAVSHALAIKSLLQRIFGIDVQSAWLIRLDNTCVTKIHCSAHGWHLDYTNATPHLAEEGL